MFDALSDRLTGVFDRLRGRGALNDSDVREAMREVRVARLEADVALPVARKFIDAVTEKAVGQSVLKSVTPGQQVVKIVHDELVEMLGGADHFAGTPLSMRAVTGKPIKFAGTGEKLDAIETFSAERVAGRIFGMGDIVSFVEK